MSTPSLEDVLAQHRPTIASGGFTDCRCGKNLDEKGSWAAHAAEVIREHWELTPITATSRRVWASRYPGTGFTEPSKNAIAAAREALAPIRDIHFPRDVYVRHMATGDAITVTVVDVPGNDSDADELTDLLRTAVGEWTSAPGRCGDEAPA